MCINLLTRETACNINLLNIYNILLQLSAVQPLTMSAQQLHDPLLCDQRDLRMNKSNNFVVVNFFYSIVYWYKSD
jgi:hypothetical protein